MLAGLHNQSSDVICALGNGLQARQYVSCPRCDAIAWLEFQALSADTDQLLFRCSECAYTEDVDREVLQVD
jgi:hypothetical protein